jgi:hypothetical protein
MSKPAGLDDHLVSACLLEVSAGVIGRVVNLLRVALGRAYRRQACRIELCDLQAATASWAVVSSGEHRGRWSPGQGVQQSHQVRHFGPRFRGRRIVRRR